MQGWATQQPCDPVCLGAHGAKDVHTNLAVPIAMREVSRGKTKSKLLRSTQYQLCRCLLSPTPGTEHLGNIWVLGNRLLQDQQHW